MTRLQLLFSGLVCIISMVTIYALTAVSHLKNDLESISKQLENTNYAFLQATAKSNRHNSNESKTDENRQNEYLALQQEFTNLSSKIETLTSKLNDLKRQQTLSANSAVPSQGYTSTSPDQIDSAHTSEPIALNEAESQAILENALTDPTQEDQIWSGNTTLEIEQLFTHSPNLKTASDFNVACGGQLCKIQIILPKETDYLEKEMFQMNMLADLSPYTSRSITNQNILANGNTQITHYIARQGYPLPTEPKPSVNNVPEDIRNLFGNSSEPTSDD